MPSSLDPSSGLPAVSPREIGDVTVQTVVLRELHAALGVGRDFNTWVKDRIAKYGFAEGADFVSTFSPNFVEKSQRVRRGRPS